MVCANVDGHGCGTVTLISHPSVEYLIGITAKHVLSVNSDLEKSSIYCRAMASNDNFLESETKTTLFGCSSDNLLSDDCDVGIMIPHNNTETIPNFVEKLGVVRLSSTAEANALRNLMTHRPNYFILAKQGCSTGRTTATIKPGSMTATQFCVTSREFCPVASHGDSGALWVVIKSPSNLYNQLVVGVWSYIELEKEVDGKSSIVTIECYCTPVWLWLDWPTVAVGEVLREVLSLEDVESLSGETVNDDHSEMNANDQQMNVEGIDTTPTTLTTTSDTNNHDVSPRSTQCDD